MSYEPEERKDHQLFGLVFRATAAEQRRLWLRLCDSPESRRWGPLNTRVKYCGLDAHDELTVRLAQDLEAAEAAMTKLAARLIDELEMERLQDG